MGGRLPGAGCVGSILRLGQKAGIGVTDEGNEQDRPTKANQEPDTADATKHRRAVRFLQYTSPAMVAMLTSTKAMSASLPP